MHWSARWRFRAVSCRSDSLIPLDPFVPLMMMKKRGKESDYEAKTVMLGGRRYIVCRNHQEAQKDAADRASILAALERQLAKGDKALVGNTGFRRYLKTINEEHVPGPRKSKS
jgi:hypothetical protein